MLFITICVLGLTADEFLSPSLSAISDKFSCSQSVAGVTLLAFGNGASDIFSALAEGSNTLTSDVIDF